MGHHHHSDCYRKKHKKCHAKPPSATPPDEGTPVGGNLISQVYLNTPQVSVIGGNTTLFSNTASEAGTAVVAASLGVVSTILNNPQNVRLNLVKTNGMNAVV